MGIGAVGDSADPLGPRQGEWHRRTTLRDGTPVLLRQIRPEDRHRLVEGFRRLSPASRYLRFHTEMEDFTATQLDYLTRVDHLDHEALVAVDLAHPEVPGIGVARYIRDPDAREVAEAAVTVADEYHGQGAGTLLLGALAARAREQGIRVFRNYVLAGNTAMLDVFDQLGAERELEADHLWRVDLALPDHERDLPDSAAGRAFMAAARDGFRLSSLLPPVWGRRPRPAKGEGGVSAPDGIEAELASLRGELDTWLADRERRRPAWPADDGRDDEADEADSAQ